MLFALGFIVGLLFQALLLSPALLVVALRIWPDGSSASSGIESAKPSIRQESATGPGEPAVGGPWDGVGPSHGDWHRL